jgi:hypothetical protein
MSSRGTDKRAELNGGCVRRIPHKKDEIQFSFLSHFSMYPWQVLFRWRFSQKIQNLRCTLWCMVKRILGTKLWLTGSPSQNPYVISRVFTDSPSPHFKKKKNPINAHAGSAPTSGGPPMSLLNHVMWSHGQTDSGNKVPWDINSHEATTKNQPQKQPVGLLHMRRATNSITYAWQPGRTHVYFLR